LFTVQALEAKFVQMLSTQNEEHRKEMTQLKDGLAKEIAQLEVNVWCLIHLN
jgi:hypothetical protein